MNEYLRMLFNFIGVCSVLWIFIRACRFAWRGYVKVKEEITKEDVVMVSILPLEVTVEDALLTKLPDNYFSFTSTLKENLFTWDSLKLLIQALHELKRSIEEVTEGKLTVELKLPLREFTTLKFKVKDVAKHGSLLETHTSGINVVIDTLGGKHRWVIINTGGNALQGEGFINSASSIQAAIERGVLNSKDFLQLIAEINN